MKNKQLTIVLLILFCLRISDVSGQCSCASVSIPATAGPFCPGYVYTLTPTVSIPPGATVSSYTWIPAAGVSPASGLGVPGTTTIIAPGVTTTYTLVTTSFGPDLICDGSFDLATIPLLDACTTTGYVNGILTPLSDTFTINNDLYNADPSWGHHFYDHTHGAPPGQMMIVNGWLAPPASPPVVWEQTVPVCPNSTYQFSAYYAYWSFDPGLTRNADLKVIITPLPSGPPSTYSFPSLSTAFAWANELAPLWNSGTATGAKIQIIDYTSVENYNDFALDDISFYGVCSDTDTIRIVVNPAPISGPSVVCQGSSIILTDASPGGSWNESTIYWPVATASPLLVVSPTCSVTGMSPGTAVITYTLPGGCAVYDTITVIGEPNVCVTVTFNSAEDFLNFTGPSGDTLTFTEYDCMGGVVGTVSVVPPATISWFSLPPTVCYICITSVTYMGCIWALTPHSLGGNGCCANRTMAWRHSDPSAVTPITENSNPTVFVIPNPNKGVFTIQGSLSNVQSSKQAKLEVIDMVGQTVYTDAATLDNGNISKNITLGDNIANGVYFIRLKNDDVSQVIRFTLSR
jgi:type IX secretion system substrate protein